MSNTSRPPGDVRHADLLAGNEHHLHMRASRDDGNWTLHCNTRRMLHMRGTHLGLALLFAVNAIALLLLPSEGDMTLWQAAMLPPLLALLISGGALSVLPVRKRSGAALHRFASWTLMQPLPTQWPEYCGLLALPLAILTCGSYAMYPDTLLWTLLACVLLALVYAGLILIYLAPARLARQRNCHLTSSGLALDNQLTDRAPEFIALTSITGISIGMWSGQRSCLRLHRMQHADIWLYSDEFASFAEYERLLGKLFACF